MTVDQLREDVYRWLRYAADDLFVAEQTATLGQFAPHIGCFHAQQAVEKAIKASLLWSQIEPPRRHDLDHLRGLLPHGWDIHNRHPDLTHLSDWAVEARYPDDLTEASEQDAREAAREARAVWETVLDDLERHGLDISRFR